MNKSGNDKSNLNEINKKLAHIQKHLDFMSRDMHRNSSRINIILRQVDNSQRRLNELEKMDLNSDLKLLLTLALILDGVPYEDIKKDVMRIKNETLINKD